MMNYKPKIKCGQCGSTNQHEAVWYGNKYIIRCRICNNQKVIGMIITSCTDNGKIDYKTGYLHSKVIF